MFAMECFRSFRSDYFRIMAYCTLMYTLALQRNRTLRDASCSGVQFNNVTV